MRDTLPVLPQLFDKCEEFLVFGGLPSDPGARLDPPVPTVAHLGISIAHSGCNFVPAQPRQLPQFEESPVLLLAPPLHTLPVAGPLQVPTVKDNLRVESRDSSEWALGFQHRVWTGGISCLGKGLNWWRDGSWWDGEEVVDWEVGAGGIEPHSFL